MFLKRQKIGWADSGVNWGWVRSKYYQNTLCETSKELIDIHFTHTHIWNREMEGGMEGGREGEKRKIWREGRKRKNDHILSPSLMSYIKLSQMELDLGLLVIRTFKKIKYWQYSGDRGKQMSVSVNSKSTWYREWILGQQRLRKGNLSQKIFCLNHSI